MSRSRESLFDRWFLAVFLIAILLFGGSARVDSVGLVFVRALAVLAIAVSLPHWWADAERSLYRRNRPLLLLLAAAAAWMFIQLVPLPPGVWSALPGHGELATKMAAAGIEIGWRPLALSPGRAIHSLLDLLVPLAVVLVIGRTSDSSLRQLPLRLLAFLAVAAMLGVLQMLAGEGAPYFHRITNVGAAVGFFANRNHHAVFLALYWPLLLWYIHGRNDRAGTHASTLLGVLGGVGIMLAIMAAGSRAGLAIGGASFLATSVFLYRMRGAAAGTESAAWLVRLTLLGTIAATLLGGVAMLVFGAGFMDRLDQGEVVSDLRFAVLPVLNQLIWHYAPFGSGFGSFEAAYKIAEPVELLSLQYLNHAHNDYLELLIDGGLPALGLLVGWVLIVLRAARAAWGHERSAASDRVGVVAMLMMLAIFAAASLVDYPLRTPALAALAALATALLYRRPDIPRERRKGQRTAAGFR
ncbi:O-antigen ligase domain-containing protein [Sphingopyxis sp. YF1]|uniref:O-antigen ligase family protein n=1 Tax=Sphingopyxis sp. YF1 TaxID=2482763 RepID=UPI001F61054F|nr:O-antigen ligase family protein [Sphingopyxis sp. YF1]UNU42684.1 O-antigen ligase domain-containing protein [Sphingopyxis sp. YF1]